MEQSLKILRRDKRFLALIKKHGVADLTSRKQKNIFLSLLRAIIFQQLSGHAARAIHARILALFPKNTPTPPTLSKMSVHKLRAAGLSVQKIRYMRDLAEKYLDGTIDEKHFKRMTSEEIIEHLTAVKGVGEWTAHMVLIFTLGRQDILPVGDLGIQKGFQIVYKLRSLPDKKKMEQLATPWRAQASIASWYLWAAADDAKKPTPKKR